MLRVNKSPQKKAKKPSSKHKWREIEAIRDRYQLMKELQEDDYSLEMELDDLVI